MTTARRYRPAIPARVKLQVVLNQRALCGCGCGAPLSEQVEFDHDPALIFREYDATTRTYTPDANDPAFIKAKLVDCHARKTFGPGGEKRITTRGSDIGEKARVRRLSRDHEEFRRRMLARATGEAAPDAGKPRKRKPSIPSRPFPKRPANLTRSKK